MPIHMTEVIAIIFGIGPIVIGLVLWIITIKMLRDIRDALRGRDWGGAK